jgi:hypothetical protein
MQMMGDDDASDDPVMRQFDQGPQMSQGAAGASPLPWLHDELQQVGAEAPRAVFLTYSAQGAVPISTFSHTCLGTLPRRCAD